MSLLDEEVPEHQEVVQAEVQAEEDLPSVLREALDATQAASPDDATVEVRDARGRLVFEYDRNSDRAVLHMPEGDLVLAVGGRFEVAARDGVKLSSDGAVSLSSARGIDLSVEGDRPARLGIEPGEVSVVTGALTSVAQRVELAARRVRMNAHLVETQVDRARHVADVVETKAKRIVERARDVYREVERLSQHRAGTLRWVARKTAHLVGEDTVLRARKKMKIKGEKIHLA